MLVADADDVAPVLLDDADRVRKAEQPLTPGADEIAVAGEDHHRVRVIAIEAVDPVLGIDRQRRRLQLQPFRNALPLLIDLVGVFAAADDRVHRFPLVHFGCLAVMVTRSRQTLKICARGYSAAMKWTTVARGNREGLLDGGVAPN